MMCLHGKCVTEINFNVNTILYFCGDCAAKQIKKIPAMIPHGLMCRVFFHKIVQQVILGVN